MLIGDVIRKYRKQAGITQEEMARRLGVTTPAVNKWEKNNTQPDITLLAPIARLLGITTDTLLSYRESLSPEEIAAFVKKLDQDLEKRETSVRLMLLERDGIRDLKDGGMELLPAAETYAGNLLAEISRVWTGRLWIAALLVLGGLAGFAGIPAAFEKTHSRLWLILPVLLSFALAAAAETLCRLQGRGDSYSALAVAVFAAVQLLLVIPKAKKA